MLRSQGLTFEEAIRALQRVAQAQCPSPRRCRPRPRPARTIFLASARAASADAQRARPARGRRGAAGRRGRTSRRADIRSRSRSGARRAGIAIAGANGTGARCRRSGDTGSARPSATAGRHSTRPARRPILHRQGIRDCRAPSFGAPPSMPPQTRDEPPPAPSRPQSPAPARIRQSGWAPAARSPTAQPATRGSRSAPRSACPPPPIPPTPGPLQIPGQISQPYQGGRGAGPEAQGGRPAGVPWQDVADGLAPRDRMACLHRRGSVRDQARDRGPGQILELVLRPAPARDRARAGRGRPSRPVSCVHNIPPRMKVGVSLVCEARIGRNEVRPSSRGCKAAVPWCATK